MTGATTAGRIDLNADLGESLGAWRLGDDEAMLDVVTSANIACGFHAGDSLTLQRTCALAVERGVVIGAQVGYRDLAGFGRRFIDMDPAELTAWFHTSFVDGYDWVMLPNVVGMSQYADGGLMATKPYAAGGAYLNRMSDFCGECRYSPAVRVGPDACPFTAGYWAFLDRNESRLAGNPRLRQPLAGLRRLADRDAVVAQEAARGSGPP